MKRTKLRRISKKRLAQMPSYHNLIAKLIGLCGNKSELSGKTPDWQSLFFVEPHHVTGRNGKRLLDPFGIIMLTRIEHDTEEGKIRGEKVGNKKLLALVREIRIKQGFASND